MRGTDYVLKRVAFAIVTVFVAVTINFVLFRLAPGNAVSNLSRVPHATQELRHALDRRPGEERLVADQPQAVAVATAEGSTVEDEVEEIVPGAVG